jgi:hypothetical protein
VHVERIGDDCPIMVIDNFFSDPDAVRCLGLDGRYDSSLAFYPGLHSRIGEASLAGFFATLARLLAVFGYSQVRPQSFLSDFSIVTTAAVDMLSSQKHPHIDGLPLAGVVYLTPHMDVGTSFFRHVPLGLSMLKTEPEIHRYNAWLQEFGEATQPAGYAVESTGVWHKLHAIEGKYNRMVIYPGNAFHSIDMRDIASQQTIASARLTQRIFLRSLD